METNELHRGRLIDHIQLVVSDLARTRRFYSAVFEALKVPIGGEGPGFFWAAVHQKFVSEPQVDARGLKLQLGVRERPDDEIAGREPRANVAIGKDHRRGFRSGFVGRLRALSARGGTSAASTASSMASSSGAIGPKG